MCNWVVQNNNENPFRLFVYLKLCYPSGKIQWIKQDKEFAGLTLNNCNKTINSNFNKIIELGWLYFDDEFEYYRLVSFDVLRNERHWGKRRSFPFTYKDVSHIRATLGAILYTQLHKSYCRKYLKKRRSNVLKSESASKPFTFSCDIKKYAEVSVLSIESIFGLSINKAVRLKQAAKKEKLIEVKKQYLRIEYSQVYAAKKGNYYRGESQNIIFKDGNYYLQLIDRIYSELYFKKRKKLETL